ncbi:MAG: cyclic nucleotide-binding domain-containing protein [Polyangiaceae bacterium]|nr:cyclic nucleotide-binding domain-containing protein [Polyangiaceae bacterium]
MPNLEGAEDSVHATDEVIRLLAHGDPKAALAWAAPLVKLAPASPVHWFLLGVALHELGHEGPATTALGLAVDRGIATSNLPVALAACLRIGALGASNEASLERLARTFSKDSKLLQAQTDVPPSLPGQRIKLSALAPTVSEEEVLKLVNGAMEAASELPDATGVSFQPLFSSLGAAGLGRLLQAFRVIFAPQKMMVVEEGTPGQEAFVLARGELEVVKSNATEGMVLARLGNGALFGEMALLSRAPRAASVVAARPCIVLVAERSRLDKLAEEDPEVGHALAQFCRQRMIDNLLRTSRLLRAVSPKERPLLIPQFETQTHEAGTRLIAQGQQSDGMYLIASGEVQVVHQADDGDTLIATLGPGEVVGEVALVLRRPATADVIAVHPSVVLHLPRERFLNVVKNHPQLLAELYELAVRRDEETSSIVAEEATNVDDCILL